MKREIDERDGKDRFALKSLKTTSLLSVID